MSVLRYLPRFRRAAAAIDELNQRRSWSRVEIETEQLEKLNRLWQHASSSVAYYRQLKEECDLPDQFCSIVEYQQRVPVLQKDPVRDNRNAFLSRDHEPGRWLRTGGSTGVPTSIYWSHTAHLANLRSRYAWLSRYGVDLFDQQAFLWGHAGSFAPGWKGRIARVRQPIEDRLRNRQRFSAYEIGLDDLDRYLDSMNRYQTKWVYGYSSAILLLANRALELQFKPDGLKLFVMTGEPAMPLYKQRVAAAFDALGRTEYGSVECGNLAFENLTNQLEIQEHSRLIEALPRQDGSYDIVVTVLDNPSFPLLRYRIGDTTSGPILRPTQGPAQLTDVQGRNNDFLVSRTGQFVHSNAIKHAMEQVPKITRFQALQNEDGSVELTVEKVSPDQIDHQAITQKLIELLGGFPISIQRQEKITGNLAGKHQWVISKLYEQRQGIRTQSSS